MNTREQILRSAVQLFGTKGYQSTSIQDICDLAGVSKGAVFHYFNSKSELLFEIHEEIIDILLKQYEIAFKNNSLSPSQKLRELVGILIDLMFNYRPYIVVLFQEYRNIQDHNFELVKAKRDRSEEIVSAVINQGISSGEFRQDLEFSILAKLFFGICNWTYIWLNPEGDLTPQQIADNIWRVYMGGIMTCSPDAQGGK
ncbi:MAG: TetR/AcrR family transcriptional regulator [Bacillota bacterium]